MSKGFLGYTEQEAKKFKKYAWMALLGFSILYAFLYNGRLNMGLALPMMMEEMGWTKTQAGLLSSVLFWTYGLGHLVNGRLGEIFGPKKIILVGLLLSAGANLIISFQSSIGLIAFLWALNGYFQSMLWSPGISLITKWWPSHKRGFATGFANGFSGVAQIIVWFSVLASISAFSDLGWRAAFRIPLISMVAMGAVYWVMVKAKPSDVGLKDYEEEDEGTKEQEAELQRIVQERGKLYPYIHLFSQWRFIIWCFIIAISNISRYGLLTWIPTYYVQELNMNVKSGIFSSVVLPVGMALGTFIVPWASDKFGKNGRLPAVVICAIVSAVSVFIFPSLKTLGTASIGLFIAGFFVYAINGVVWAYSTDVGGRVFAGTAAGVLDWAAYMGAALQAIIFGRVLDKTGNWNIVFTSIAVICVLMMVLALIANIKPKNKIKKA
ncbi:MFS transporter [Crassaminicella profunda]|uniref:MFS transporter n=1 Tax=Crassaminicella profunda TaxID=1286698 RepID=UPI001CA6C6D2|nr:MFS transporter [Crassaminicella profunda]QZY56089.1 MFS transporter [Crassaminicella profunda]